SGRSARGVGDLVDHAGGGISRCALRVGSRRSSSGESGHPCPGAQRSGRGASTGGYRDRLANLEYEGTASSVDGRLGDPDLIRVRSLEISGVVGGGRQVWSMEPVVSRRDTRG